MTARKRSFIGMDPMLTDPPAVQDPRPGDTPPPSLATVSPEATARRRSARPTPQGSATGKRAVSVRVQLGPETTDRLEGVARATGRDVEQLMRHLRKSVAADFRGVLAADAPPAEQAAPVGGASDRLHLVLSDEEYGAAQAFFDPLGFGEHAMRDGMRPVLARLYRDWTLRIAER